MPRNPPHAAPVIIIAGRVWTPWPPARPQSHSGADEAAGNAAAKTGGDALWRAKTRPCTDG